MFGNRVTEHDRDYAEGVR